MRLNSTLLLIVLFSFTFINVKAALGVYISEYYMFFSTNFTNNGGVDNSTCDLKVDGIYSTTLGGNNVAAFNLIETNPGYMIYDGWM